MPDRVVDYLVRTVADRGITQIFGVDGANIEDLYDAIFDAGVRQPASSPSTSSLRRRWPTGTPAAPAGSALSPRLRAVAR